MHEFKAVIIDDEPDSREIIATYLSKFFPEVKVAGEASSIKSAKKLLANTKFDLLFLDIQLTDGTGFDLLETIGNINFDIIFITAYDEFAIDAIKVNALDYLLKPFESEEFVSAVNRYISKEAQTPLNNIEALLKSVQLSVKRNKITIPTQNGFKVVNIEDIMHLESSSNYTYLHMIDASSILVSKTLKEFEQNLPDQNFCRIHHSHVVNVNCVAEYIKGRGGQVILSNGKSLPVSQNKKDHFLSIWS